jgi:hypothetical protein
VADLHAEEVVVMMERGFTRYLPLVAAVVLLGIGIAQLRQRRRMRSFREDPLGALKDRSELLADRAQGATEEALARIQESLDEIRGRLPEINRKRMDRRRKELNKRLIQLNEQIQELLKDLRATGIFSR